MKILFYCPDRHIVYDGGTPDRTGVGGGITARLRMATALAMRGHQVTLVGNVETASVYERVQYVPLANCPATDVDVLIVHSSGGAGDVSEASGLKVQANARVLLVSGITCPRHAEEQRFDVIYSPSNFNARYVRDNWPIESIPGFVTDYGAVRAPLLQRWLTRRHSKRMIYTSHPSKGLDAAICLLRLLREADPDYELHVYGGNALWGMSDSPPPQQPGLFYRGMIGQKQMALEYPRAAYAIHIQNREEPFGISLVEAMSAGCIALASPVGAFTELVRHRVNGYIVPGDPAAQNTLQIARSLILEDNPRHPQLSKAAQKVPFSWATLARSWEAHFRVLLKEPAFTPGSHECTECGGAAIKLEDGAHCLTCSHYSRGVGGF